MSFSILRSQLKYVPISYLSNACCIYHPSQSDHFHCPNDFLWSGIHGTPRCAIFYRLNILSHTVSLCVCVCVCVCIYIYMCVCVCIYIYIYIYVCVYVCVFVCVYVCVFVCMYIYIYMCVCVCICVCLCVCVCIYIYIYSASLWAGIEDSVSDFWRPCNAVVRNTSCRALSALSLCVPSWRAQA